MVPTKHLTKLDTADEIYDLSSRYRVSSEVYLRRLHEEKFITDENFYMLLKEIRSRVKKTGFIPRTTPPYICTKRR